MIKLPLGNIAEDLIPNAVDSMLDAIAVHLKPTLPAHTSMRLERVLLQYEVAADNKTVRLKVLKKLLLARTGILDGFNISIFWHRDRPAEITIAVDAMSRLVDHSFTGVFVAAALIAGVISLRRGRIRESEIWLLYLLALPITVIPYLLLRSILSLRARRKIVNIERSLKDRIA